MDTPTHFVEANALLALGGQAPDYDDVRQHLASLMTSELGALERQAWRLVKLCHTIQRERRDT